jgi:DOPA 4,5-dioxygenase
VAARNNHETFYTGVTMNEEDIIRNTEEDQAWADLLSPLRRKFILSAGLTAAGLAAGDIEAAGQEIVTPGNLSFKPIVPPPDVGKSPWGYETYKEATPQPLSLRPGEERGLPKQPRPYTDIKSYHAHFYFDEDSYEKAALVRKWTIERFPVELGNWNLEPRGPHVTPSFYFGFTNDLLPIIVPWLQLNSLGLTILLHPNTDNPRADHLYDTLWVNRSQAVNAYGMPKKAEVEKIFPNIKPTVKLET